MNNNVYDVLKNQSYRHWLVSRFLANFAKNMQALAIAWQVYDLTKQPLALGFVGLAEAVPFIAIGLWAGHAADRYAKKSLIVGSTGGLSLCSFVFLLLSLSPAPSVIPIYAVMGLTGLLASFEFTASNAYVQTIVPKEDFPKASAWTLAQFQITVICGPLVSGWVIAQSNVKVAYGLASVIFLLSAAVAVRLKKLPVVVSAVTSEGWDSIKEGLKFLRTRRLVVACMTLDMLAVFWGDVVAILPVFAALFAVGPVGLGILRAAPAVGSLVASLVEANRPFVRPNWKNFLLSVTAFGVSVLAFGLSQNYIAAVFFLGLSGAADGVGVIIRQSVYQAFTPDHLRGRVASVSSIFIRLSNEFGAFESGLAAQLMGARPSVLFGGCMTLMIVAAMRFRHPRINEEGST